MPEDKIEVSDIVEQIDEILEDIEKGTKRGKTKELMSASALVSMDFPPMQTRSITNN